MLHWWLTSLRMAPVTVGSVWHDVVQVTLAKDLGIEAKIEQTVE